MQVAAEQRAVGGLCLVELPLLSLGQVAAVGFDVGAFLLLNRFVIRQELFRLGRSQLAALERALDAGPLIAHPAIDLFAPRMVLGKAAAGRADRIARTAADGRSHPGGCGPRPDPL